MRAVLPLLSLILAPLALAWAPVGSLEDFADRASIARLRPGVKAYSFSSYDRTGLNNDGFQGTYSKIREENGNSVIAEMEGPGCIQRFWVTHSRGDKPGLLDLKGEHIRIYCDGKDTPVLDVPLEQLFSGEIERFPKPLVGEGLGGYFCYVPIPYRDGCKVVLEGLGVKFYQLNYVKFPSAKGVKTFSMDLSKREREALSLTAARWQLPIAFLKNTEKTERQHIAIINQGRFDLDLGAVERNRASKPSRKRLTVLQGIAFKDFDADEVLNARIEIRFDGAESPAIDLPLTMLLGETFNPQPIASMFFGEEEGLRYFTLPMPYHDTCNIRIKSVKTLEGELLLRRDEIKEDPEGFGYLHSQYHEDLPTNQEGVLHTFLQTQGTGHYVGTFMATDGPTKLPFWMEGDDIWNIDGEMRIHGTGSEDYFNCGWYALKGRLDHPGGFPTHGFPIYVQSDNGSKVSCYRWHFADPVPFETSIDAGIEHGEVNKTVANYRSAAFYYSARP